MPGFTIMPINRAPCCTPSIASSSDGVVVAGKPLENLIDPTLDHQCWITPAGGAGGQVIVSFALPATPSASGSGGDVDFQVTGASVANHNLDGVTVEWRGHTANSYAAATSIFSGTLDNFCGFPDLFRTHAAYAFRYWFLRLSGNTPATVKIGGVAFGPTMDLGAYMRPGSKTPRSQSSTGRTSRSRDIPGVIDDPMTSRRLEFRNPVFLTPDLMTNRAKGAGNYVAFNTLSRAFSDRYQISLASAAKTRVGVCAGAGYPMPYHEGDMKGVSAFGRPAHWGFMEADFSEMWGLNFSAFSLSVRDATPRAIELKPGTN